jgi:threonine dehydratase
VLGHIATRLKRVRRQHPEVGHKRVLLEVPAMGARLHVTLETRDRARADAILEAQEGYQPLRLEAGAAMD